MTELRVPMPKLSMTMEEGELAAWRKAEGDHVRAGEVLCDVLSDKVEMEVESPADGVVSRLLAPEGATVAVGAPIATITTEADDLLEGLLEDLPTPDAKATAGAGTSAGATGEATAAAAGPAEVAAAADPRPKVAGGIAVAPAARRRAAELGVDLGAVTGGGPRGLIRVEDVEAAAGRQAGVADAAPASAVPPAAASTPSTAAAGSGGRRVAVRAAIARRMTPTAAVPQFTVFGDLDLEDLEGARRRAGDAAGRPVGWTAVLLAAAARALRQHPNLNSRWEDGRVVSEDALRVAVAVDTPAGLLAPVLDAPDRMPAVALDRALRALVDRTRLGKLTPADQAPGTFTLSNLGPLGVQSFQALLTPPQAAALSVGAIERRPVVRDGGLFVRLGCQVGLTVDHRVADGADAARYLATLREELAHPDTLLR